jgi:hypothetical protein
MDDPHEGLGQERRVGHDEDALCSGCGTSMPDDLPPLVIYADGGRRVWIYCKTCEDSLLAKFATLRWP